MNESVGEKINSQLECVIKNVFVQCMLDCTRKEEGGEEDPLR